MNTREDWPTLEFEATARVGTSGGNAIKCLTVEALKNATGSEQTAIFVDEFEQPRGSSPNLFAASSGCCVLEDHFGLLRADDFESALCQLIQRGRQELLI